MRGRIVAGITQPSIKPHETCKIHVQFHNMAPCPFRYELDPRDGVISKDGVYTAPDKQGVHVIRVLCEHDPLINTFVYADVKK